MNDLVNELLIYDDDITIAYDFIVLNDRRMTTWNVCGLLDAGVLKEFLREMPEPLCSDSLYQMLMDALNVQISGDADGNARLMLGILDCLPAVNQVRYLLQYTSSLSFR